MAIFGFAARYCSHLPRASLSLLPFAATAMLVSHGIANAGDAQLLPNIATTTTVPANGDLNPYGVVFVPPKFHAGSNHQIAPGDILVSNFNASSNQQGTGTTIIQYTPTPSGAVAGPNTAKVFFQERTTGPNAPLPGLTLALGVLQRGFVVVGVVNTTDGTSNTVRGGPLLVIDAAGNLKQSIQPDPIKTKINGPWGMAIADHFNTASLFVSNVLDGTVTRLDVRVSNSGLDILSATTIASGYQHGTDPAALVVGPAGLAYEAATDTLYVAAEVDNAIFKVTDASKRASPVNMGIVFQKNGNLRGPVGLTLAPNGHIIATNSDAANPDAAHPSEVVEFTHDGKFVGEYNINEAPGAAFGVAFGPFNEKTRTVNFVAVNNASNDMSVHALPTSQH